MLEAAVVQRLSAGGPMPSSMTADQVAAEWREACLLKPLHVVITGARVGGLGFEAARSLALNGCTVTLCCRDKSHCDEALAAILEENGSAKVSCAILDLGSLLSVRRCAESLLEQALPIDCLIHCAGVLHNQSCQSADGFELQWQVNFLGPFYLTQLLMPLLREAKQRSQRASRVVWVSSILHYFVVRERGIDFEELATDHTNDCCRRFGESKLAPILCARAFARHFGDDVISVTCSTGYCRSTKHNRHISLATIMKTLAHCLLTEMELVKKLKHRSAAQCAATIVFCALPNSVQPGGHYEDQQLSNTVHPQADCEEAQERLWGLVQAQIDRRLAQLQSVSQQVDRIIQFS